MTQTEELRELFVELCEIHKLITSESKDDNDKGWIRHEESTKTAKRLGVEVD